VWNPSAPSEAAVSVAWSEAPVPFSTETVTVDAAGRGVPVMESVEALIPSTWSMAAWSCASEGNSTSP
jgi:hypothetical protein